LKLLHRMWSRIAGSFTGRNRDAELSAEFESHIAMLTEKNMRRGMSPDEARRAAILTFGGVEPAKENYRDQRGLPAFDSLQQDVRFGLRMLGKNPGWTLLVAVVLALGIGPSVTVFSVISEVLLKPLPSHRADQLVVLFERPPGGGERDRTWVAPPTFFDWQLHNDVFAEMAALEPTPLSFSGHGEPEELNADFVSPNTFRILGVAALHGRIFSNDEDRPGRNQVVLLGETWWREQFGADPNVLGTVLTLGDKTYTVIGVVPSSSFPFPLFENPDIWVPLSSDRYVGADRRGRSAFVIARLKPSVMLAQAQRAMDALEKRIADMYPATNKDWGVTVISMRDSFVGDVKPSLLMLMGAVVFVLLISCANIANLLLARGLTRERDMSIRTLLGASSWRLVRQLFAEGFLLSLLGSGLGMLLAYGALNLVRKLLPSSIPHSGSLHLNISALLFTVALLVFSAVLFGFAPAFRLFRFDISRVLGKERSMSGVGTARTRARHSVLVTCEVALCSILLIGAGLMIRTFLHLRSVNPGFDASGVLAIQVTPPYQKYRTPDRMTMCYQDIFRRVSNLPGTRSVAMASSLPLLRISSPASIGSPGQFSASPANLLFVSSRYFETLGIPIVNGREFEQIDSGRDSQTVIVSESVARRLWPNENPVGQYATLNLGRPQPVEVIGVAGDVHQLGVTQGITPEVYVPFSRFSRPLGFMFLVVRGYSNPSGLIPSIKREIWEVDDQIPLSNIITMQEFLSAESAQARFYMTLLSALGAIAIVLTAAGIFAVVANSVVARWREIGIRLALGARPSGILSTMLRQSLISVSIGLTLGTLGSLFLTRVLSKLLFGISRYDPLTFGFVALTLLLVAMCACYFPAARATRMDPAATLRHE
jgi:putative ABC transport system permease protein